MVQSQPVKKPITKKGLVEWLKILSQSSNPSTEKKKKERKKEKEVRASHLTQW
jgi:hypothetical protein